MKYYAGVGSRECPPNICKEMTLIASELEDMGYWLRSGGAIGADFSFQKGVKKNAEIWLPTKDFNQDFQDQFPQHIYPMVAPDDIEAWKSVDEFHPDPNKLSDFGRQAMARNWKQIFGDGIASEFVICWTPEGKFKGGTAQALRISEHFEIPIYNMFHHSRKEVLKSINFINTFKN